MAFPRPRLVPHISDGESGSWDTAASSGHAQEFPTPSSKTYGSSGNGTKHPNGPTKGRPSLDTMARKGLWPTPNVPNGGRSTKHAEQIGNSFYHEGKKVQFGLEAAVKMWPTPTVKGDYNKQGLSQKSGDGLATAVKKWPTPVRRDSRSFKGAQHMASWTGAEGLAETVATVEQTRSGALNPTWVEWLMGFPLGWTDCGDSATRSSRKSRNGSGGD